MKKYPLVSQLLFAPAFLAVSAFAQPLIPFDYSGQTLPLLNLPAPDPTSDESYTYPISLPKPKKQWTVMVYLNGKNNLEANAIKDLNEMELVGSREQLNIVVEIGRMKGQDGDATTFGDWTGNRRYVIQRDYDSAKNNLTESLNKISSPMLPGTDKNSDMGNYKNIIKFVKWTKKNFPARHYMLVVWDHGGGWKDPKIKKKTGKKQAKAKILSFDEEKTNYIRTSQIKSLVKEIGGVDVLAFDACLMQMIEVAYEARSHVKVLVGSEETLPVDGFNYTAMLMKLAKNPGATPEEAGTYIVDTTINYYKKYNKAATMSALRAAELKLLAIKLSSWVEVAKNKRHLKALEKARDSVVRFSEAGGLFNSLLSTYGDIYNFVEIASNNTLDMMLKAKSAELMTFISHDVVIKSDHSGDKFKNTHGISINIDPIIGDNQFDYGETKYKTLSFARASKWLEFMQWANKELPSTAGWFPF